MSLDVASFAASFVAAHHSHLHHPRPCFLSQTAASEQALLLPSGGHQELKEDMEAVVACNAAVLEQKKLEQLLENDGGYVWERESLMRVCMRVCMCRMESLGFRVATCFGCSFE